MFRSTLKKARILLNIEETYELGDIRHHHHIRSFYHLDGPEPETFLFRQKNYIPSLPRSAPQKEITEENKNPRLWL